MERCEVEKKICSQCGIEKLLTEFHKGPGKGGRHSKCAFCRTENARKTREQLKKIVFDHYGWFCVCCGEAEPLFLSLDHTNNNGAEHRKSLKGNITLKIYQDIIDRGFPEDEYQILCMNCNRGKWMNGGVCPHENKWR